MLERVATIATLAPSLLIACVAAATAGLLLAAQLLLTVALPKVAAVARTTAREIRSQPVFWVILALGIVGLVLFAVLPYSTFGEDVKVVQDSGVTWVKVLAFLLAVWSASVSIADEIEGRTALTVLSKPVRRWQFVLGKFLGVLGPVVVVFIVLGAALMFAVTFKLADESRRMASLPEFPAMMRSAMLQTLPGLVLAWFETVVLASIAVAISTRLPMVPNLVICFSVYVIGHLVPLVVQSSVGRLEMVAVVGRLLATILPVLDHFDVQAAIVAGNVVPLEYVAWAAGYAVLYSTVALLVALLLFDGRDLA